MIRHVLLVRARPGAADGLLAAFARIAELRGRLPGLLDVSYGSSRSPEDLERGYTHGLVADFADRDALRDYADDAAHRAAGAHIVAAAVGGQDGLLVVDLEVPAGG
jgi:hypothetical protein